MTSNVFKSAAVAAALCLAPAAQAGTLVTGYTADGVFGNVALLNGADLTPTGVTESVGAVPTGLAWGAGSLFVATQGAGGSSYIDRYNTSLDSIDATSLPPFEFGQLAYGGNTLFAAADGFITDGVLRFDNDLNLLPGYIDLPQTPGGLAFGAGNLFVAYGSVLARYDVDGNLLDSEDFGAFFDFGPLAFGDGKLFAGLTFAGIGGDTYGFLAVDPLDLLSIDFAVNLGSEVRGMAFGDGGLFVGLDHSIAKYSPGDGALTAFLDLGGLHGGPLAFIPTPTRPDDCGTRVCDPGSTVPEPSAWALMILGFGASGAMLRARRRSVTVAA